VIAFPVRGRHCRMGGGERAYAIIRRR
jgi:hypothetical protein